MQTFIKWAGGKSRLWRDALCYLVPAQYGRYFEPCVGGGAVYFNLLPDTSVLSDVNKKLMGAYRSIRSDVEKVIRNLAVLQDAYDSLDADGRKELYYTIRRWFNEDPAASYLIFLNKAGFNGLYRENRSGKFNVSFGDGRDKQIYDADQLRAISRQMQGAVLHYGDFEVALSANQPEPGDFVYFDPPYIPVDANSFTKYNGDGFGFDDQLRLVATCRKLDEQGVRWVASNSDTPMTRQLYRVWASTTYQVQAARSINSDKNGRGKVCELVITNYPVSETADPDAARALLLEGVAQ